MARLWETGLETGGFEWNGETRGSVSVVSSLKRSGVYSLLLVGAVATSVFNRIRQVFESNETELFVRFALMVSDNLSIGTFYIARFHDELDNLQWGLVYNGGTQTLDIYNNAGSRIATGNVLIPADVWVMVELHVAVNSSGSIVCKINGTTSSTFNGDTDFTGQGNIRSVRLCAFSTEGTWGGNLYFDDIAVNDSDGDYQNSWIGLGGVYWLRPTADTEQIDWEPSSVGDNYAMIDETPPNTTDYVQALTGGSLDIYELTDTPEYVDRINMVRVLYWGAVTTAGSNDVQDVIRVGATVYDGSASTIVPLIPSFTLYKGPAWYLNPGTAAAWEVAEVDALEAGFEIV